MKVDLQKYKNKAVVVGTTVSALGMSAGAAFAEGTADSAVTGAFTSLIDNAVATMGAVALVAIGITAVILGFKYGRKILDTLAH